MSRTKRSNAEQPGDFLNKGNQEKLQQLKDKLEGKPTHAATPEKPAVVIEVSEHSLSEERIAQIMAKASNDPRVLQQAQVVEEKLAEADVKSERRINAHIVARLISIAQRQAENDPNHRLGQLVAEKERLLHVSEATIQVAAGIKVPRVIRGGTQFNDVRDVEREIGRLKKTMGLVIAEEFGFESDDDAFAIVHADQAEYDKSKAAQSNAQNQGS